MAKSKTVQDQNLEYLIKFLYKLLRRTLANLFRVRQYSSREKVLVMGSFICTFIFLYYHNYPKFTLLFLPWYFFAKALYQMAMEHAIHMRYNHIYQMFDQKVRIVSYKNHKMVVNSFVPMSEVQRKQDYLEHYLNKRITSIKKHSAKDYRLIEINLEDKRKKDKLKALYPLIENINQDTSKYKIPYIRGINPDGKLILGDMYQDKNILIVGVPGAGKSVLENTMLRSMMVYNDMFFILVDFKIVELCFYENFDNVHFIEKLQELEEALKILTDEMDERYSLMRGKYTHIDQHNEVSRYKKPYICIVIDEITEIRLNNGSDIENQLLILMNKGRAAGIYFLICTQNPKADQLNSSIKNSCQYRLSGKIMDTPTQVLVGVKGTEDLKTGYFKSSEGEVYYSLYDTQNTVFNKLKAIKSKGEKTNVSLKKNT